MKLERRENIEVLEDEFQYLESSETWKFGYGANRVYYHMFSSPQHQFTLEHVSISMFPEKEFDGTGMLLWVSDISPIELVHYKEQPPLRIYGAQSRLEAIHFNLSHDRISEIDTCFADVCRVFPNNERCTPQVTLERLVGVHKPHAWSWEKIIDLVYENVTKARDVLLGYAKQVPNENVAKVIGVLEMRKPTSEQCIKAKEENEKGQRY